ncbi:MAG: orotidine-5'-phosphate decarboxylase [Candidatus Kapaibacterium sp.]
MKTYDKIIKASEKNKSRLCVGLDTDILKIPHFLRDVPGGMLLFNRSIIETTRDLVCAYKINFAFYERYGRNGFDIIEKTIDAIPKDIVIIADAKRGDIGNTSKFYSTAILDRFGADAITVNPYMGKDSVSPFLEEKEKMVFLLALTSNPGSADFQKLESEGKPIYRHVVEKSLTWADRANLGYVVGATYPEELASIREIAKNNMLLIPGVGAQGGDIAATMKANGNGPAIVNVSRGIIFASDKVDFAEKAREKAKQYRDMIGGL